MDRLLFAPLQKVEDADDGMLFVEGFASTETKDRQGEIVTAAAIKAALPDYLQGGVGNLREMHGLKAAGVVEKVAIDADKRTRISARVVDPIAIKKVRTGTYRGFSVGGKVLARDAANPKIVTKISLSEISLVDRPANPEAVIDLWKADGAGATEPSAEDIAKALAEMPEEERALVLIKASRRFPLPVHR